MDLQYLYSTVKDICDVIRDDCMQNGAIARRGFQIIDAEKFETAFGETGFRVYIEDVHPEDNIIKKAITEKLEALNIFDVRIVTEW